MHALSSNRNGQVLRQEMYGEHEIIYKKHIDREKVERASQAWAMAIKIQIKCDRKYMAIFKYSKIAHNE